MILRIHSLFAFRGRSSESNGKSDFGRSQTFFCGLRVVFVVRIRWDGLFVNEEVFLVVFLGVVWLKACGVALVCDGLKIRAV